MEKVKEVSNKLEPKLLKTKTTFCYTPSLTYTISYPILLDKSTLRILKLVSHLQIESSYR